MENLEDIQISGRVTRSLRKRLTSVDSSDAGSRPTTPLPQKLTAIPELNSPSRPARMTRRSSITSLSTPAKTPGRTKVTAVAESTTNTVGTPARRSTRKRSLSISEDTPGKVGGKSTVSQPKFDTLTEEGPKSGNVTPASAKRATPPQSQSPQQEEMDKSGRSSRGKASRIHKPAPKSKMRYYYSDDSDSDVEIINLEENNQSGVKQLSKEAVETVATSAKQQTEKEEKMKIESPKQQTEQMGKTVTKSPKEPRAELLKAKLPTPKASPLPTSGITAQAKAAKLDEIIILDETIVLAPITTQNEKDTSLAKVLQSPAETHTPNKPTSTVSPKKQTATVTPNRKTPTVTPKKQMTTATPKMQTPTVTPKRQTPTASAIKSSPMIVEVVKLQRLSPEVVAKYAARNSQNLNESLVKSNNSANSKSVAFNDSDADDSAVKSVYPKTPVLTKSKSYIDADSLRETEDKSFQSDKESMASFKYTNDGLESSRSSRADGADISKESLECHDASNVLEANDEEKLDEHVDDFDTLMLQEKTPYKTKLLQSHSSSTPVLINEGKNVPLQKRSSMEIVLEENRENVSLDSEKSLRSGKTYGDSPKSVEKSPKKRRSGSEETSDAKPHNESADMDDVEDTELLQAKGNDSTMQEKSQNRKTTEENQEQVDDEFASSWVGNVSGRVNQSTKIDTIGVKKTPNKSPGVKKTPNKSPAITKSPLNKIESVQQKTKEKSDDDTQDSNDCTSYFDDEAIEAEENYRSGDSLTLEEREEINENEISEAGESIGSVDTEESGDDEEEDSNEENASFITTDSDEMLLEYSDDDEHLGNAAAQPKKKMFKRIRNISGSIDTETETAEDNIQNTNESEAALTMDVTKMIDQTINDEESNKVNGNGDIKQCDDSEGIKRESKKQRNSLNGSKTIAEATVENTEMQVDAIEEPSVDNLDNSVKSKRTSLSKCEMQKQKLNKSATENNRTDATPSKNAHKSNENNSELETSGKMKELTTSEEHDVIVAKRASLGAKQIECIIQSKRKSCNAIKSSEVETEVRHKSLNGNGDKKRGQSLSKSWQRTLASSSDSSDDDDVLSACQSLRIQRAEVYESSDESDEMKAASDHEKSRNISVNKKNKSINNGKENETEAVKVETKRNSFGQKSRKSLNNSSHESNANDSRSTEESKQLTDEYYKENDNPKPKKSISKDDMECNTFEKNYTDEKRENESHRKSLENKIKAQSLGEASDDEIDSDNEERKLTIHENSNGNDGDDYENDSADGNDEKETEVAERALSNVSKKIIAESSTESESDDDGDTDNNGDSDIEEAKRALKPTKSSAGLSVSFGHAKKSTSKDVICGQIKHSSFTIGVTVKKNASTTQVHAADSSDSSEVADDIELPKKEKSLSSQSNNSSTHAQYFSSDEAQHLEELACTERVTNISDSKRRQSLAERKTAVVSPLVKMVKRKSVCHNKEQFKPSKSFIEELFESKNALMQEKATKSRRLSKSFCDTVAVNESPKNNSVANAADGAVDMELMKEMPSSSTPRGEKTIKPNKKVDIEQILGRCDEILEAANQAKFELKRNAQKSKVKLHKKSKEPKTVHKQEDFVPLVNENETKNKEKVKTALEQALKASANILLKPKKEKSKAQIEEKQIETKRLPMQLLEAISNSEPSSTKRKKDSAHNADRETTLHSIHTIKSTSGDIIEEAVTPPKRKKKAVNKFEIPSGVVYEEALTPKKQKSVIGDFRVSPVTPRTIGSKVRRILNTGQDVIPMQSQKERKRKHAIAEPQLVLPKPKWTKSGEFVEAELLPTARTVVRTGATEFLVSALRGANKQKANRLATNTACANALNFKKSAMHRENLPRETAHEVMQRKERQRVHNHF